MIKVTVSDPLLRLKKHIGKLTNKLKSNKMRHGIFLNITISIKDMYSNPTKAVFLAYPLGHIFHSIHHRLQKVMVRSYHRESSQHRQIKQGNNWFTSPTMMSTKNGRESDPPKARFQLVDFVYLASCARGILIYNSWKPGLSIPFAKNIAYHLKGGGAYPTKPKKVFLNQYKNILIQTN